MAAPVAHQQAQMQRIIQLGSDLSLSLAMVPIPAPLPHEVLVKIHIAPINTTDLLALRGLDKDMHPFPYTPGFECGLPSELNQPCTRSKLALLFFVAKM